MNIPTTYSEWVEAIKYVETHPRNDMYIDILNNGTLEYDDILITRLKSEIGNCVFIRIGRELESFTRYLDGLVDYNSFSLKIVKLKKELIYGKKLASIKILPKDISDELNKQIDNKADIIQELLVKETQRIDKTGTINSIIRNNPINKFN